MLKGELSMQLSSDLYAVHTGPSKKVPDAEHPVLGSRSGRARRQTIDENLKEKKCLHRIDFN